VTIAGRGTSDHAAVYAQYLIETSLGLPTGLAKPSVTTVYGARVDWRDGLVLAISQSGQSPDVVAVLEAARAGGALTLAITNDRASPLASAAALTLDIHAGRERAVPATKTYVAELATLAVLVHALRPDAGLGLGIAALPRALRGAIAQGEAWLSGSGRSAVDALAEHDRALLVSRGYNLATALELALKLKETVGVFAEAYSTADFAHGPLVLASDGVPTLAIRPDGPMGADVDAALAQVDRRGCRISVIGGAEAAGAGSLALEHDLPEALTPILYVVPGQLLVEATAARRGIDPDAPVGLLKVTRTR
jgi:glucosamine--fructose-6-phosphate aminotransferase (isomerizing)